MHRARPIATRTHPLGLERDQDKPNGQQHRDHLSEDEPVALHGVSSRWWLFGVRGLGVANEQVCRPNAHFIQQAHGNGQGQLRHHIGRGHDGRDDKGQHHKIRAKCFELFDRHHIHAGQHNHHDGHFKRHAKGQKHGQHKAEIGLDVRCSRDAFGGKALDEGKHLAKHKEVAKRHAQKEQKGARHHQREHQLFLVRVQTRRHKGPHLVQHHRQGQQKSGHQQNLERHQKRRDHRGGNHGGAVRQLGLQRGGQDVKQRAGARVKGQSNGKNRS